MTLPAPIGQALEKARQRTLDAPGLAFNHAVEFDRQLSDLGWNDPLTYAARGEAAPGWASDPLAADWRQAPAHSLRTLHEACLLERRDGAQHGLAHGFVHARGHEIPALNVLYANHALNIDRLWLSFINKYLAYFRPRSAATYPPYALQLAPGASARFWRLRAVHRAQLPSHPHGPLISVLMPVHNAATTLQHAAQSILDQSWRQLELLLIDDASTDESLAIAQALAQQDTRVRLIRLRTNSGPYVAKNVGLTQATGDYITVHDADDWAFPTRLADQIQPLLDDPSGKTAVSVARMLRMQSDGRVTRLQPLSWITNDGALRLCFPSPLFRRDYFDQRLGAWDSVRVGADYEILQRLRRFEPQCLVTLDVPVMLQLEAANSLTTHALTHNDERGESPARIAYRQAWSQWHAQHASLPRLHFPQTHRPFDAPEVLKTPGQPQPVI